MTVDTGVPPTGPQSDYSPPHSPESGSPKPALSLQRKDSPRTWNLGP